VGWYSLGQNYRTMRGSGVNTYRFVNAQGEGVLVDGVDFSDDKMLVGRTFSYSDTQRYRVGPDYLQLPINRSREDFSQCDEEYGHRVADGLGLDYSVVRA
jgi:catalase